MKLGTVFLWELAADPTLKLDPNFFVAGNTLDPKVIQILKQVTSDVMQKLAEKGVVFKPAGVILTGSLTSVNYDQNSDVDFHILVDFTQFDDPALMKNFLGAFAGNYNNRFDLRGRKIELYFQDAAEPHISPGVYDILNDTWIMPPSGQKIVRTKEMFDAAACHKAKVQEFIDGWGNVNKRDKKAVNDFLTVVRNYYEGLRKMRKEGLASEGLASVGNQVFKLLRRNNTLQMITDLLTDIQDEIFEA
jgi:hypothetical protein